MSDITIERDHPNLQPEDGEIVRVVKDLVVDQDGTIENLSVVLTGHDVVRNLNKRFLGRDRHTDVLAFPLGEDKDDRWVVDGEVYVDLDTARERAPEFDASYSDEAMRYVIHGVLHLLGYDDGTTDGKAEMRALEDRYLPKI